MSGGLPERALPQDTVDDDGISRRVEQGGRSFGHSGDVGTNPAAGRHGDGCHPRRGAVGAPGSLGTLVGVALTFFGDTRDRSLWECRAAPLHGPAEPAEPPVTFSVAAQCSRSGMLGIAISTAIPAVGAYCCFASPAVGAVVTQSWINPYLGVHGLALLRGGMSAQDVVDTVLVQDPGRDLRQVGVVDTTGAAAAFTGAGCTGWAGQLTGPGYTLQGNMLIDGRTLEGMQEAFLSHADQDLPERLLRTLERGQREGGDKRGRQSASLLVVHEEAYPLVDLRVDEHADPVTELRRVWEVARRQLMPFVSTMPTRENPAGRDDRAVAELLLLPPPERAARSTDPGARR